MPKGYLVEGAFENPFTDKEITNIKKRMAKLSGTDRDVYVAKQLANVHHLSRGNAAKQLGFELNKKADDAINHYDSQVDKKIGAAVFSIPIISTATAYAVAAVFPPLGAIMGLGALVYLGHEVATNGGWSEKLMKKAGFFKNNEGALRNSIEQNRLKPNEDGVVRPTGPAGNAQTKKFSSSFPDMRQNFQTAAPKNMAGQGPELGTPKPITLSQTDVARLEAMEKAGLITPGTIPTATRYDGAKIQVIRPAASASKL